MMARGTDRGNRGGCDTVVTDGLRALNKEEMLVDECHGVLTNDGSEWEILRVL